MKTPNFVHLNVHSHYSILNGCSTIQQIVDSAIKNRMPGIAITDYGNMFGIMEFIEYVARINKETRSRDGSLIHIHNYHDFSNGVVIFL